jgi:hypothetical protein
MCTRKAMNYLTNPLVDIISDLRQEIMKRINSATGDVRCIVDRILVVEFTQYTRSIALWRCYKKGWLCESEMPL